MSEMNERQREADVQERVERVCIMLREYSFDPLTDAIAALSSARRAFDAITKANLQSREVVRSLCNDLADAGADIDELLQTIWEVMDEDNVDDANEEEQQAPPQVEGAGTTAVDDGAHVDHP